MPAVAGPRRRWRRSPISSLAYGIRMDGVRQTNIYPTCRLDKSTRALYEPEDVWAKRAALAKIDHRSRATGKTKGLFKQRVMAMSATRVTKEDMEAVDRVKETVAVLMRNKSREADIGTKERRILQPRVARAMDRMHVEKRAEFEGRVESAIEGMVYAAKRRFARLQEKLDETSVFHPDANAHRVHTQFWADLQSKVNLTKIEDDVWAKMSAEAEEAKNDANAPNFVPPRLTTPLPHDLDVVTKPASVEKQNKTSRTGQSRSSSARDEQGQGVRDDCDSDTTIGYAAEDDSSNPRAHFSDKFLCVPGYDEVGHVPTLEEFRQEWPRPTSSSFKNRQQLESVGEEGTSKGDRRGQGQTQGNQGQSQGQAATMGSVVQDLSKKDEVFRHFKKFYDKAGHAGVGLNSNGTMGLLSLTAGGSATGILPPDLSVIETIGRHTAETEEARCQMKIGQGISSTPADGRCRKSRSGSGRGSKSSRSDLRDDGSVGSGDKGNGDGLINVFRKSVETNDDTSRRAAQSAVNAFSPRNKDDGTATPTEVSGARNGGESCRGDGDSGGTRTARGRGPRSLSVRESKTESRPSTKVSVEGSSTAAELQESLEASWAALHVPARLKLGFLQKYSTLERALDLPRTAHLLEIASRVIPLREKVADLLHRMEKYGEPISAMSAFSAVDEDALYDLDCWVEFTGSATDSAQGTSYHGNGRNDSNKQTQNGEGQEGDKKEHPEQGLNTPDDIVDADLHCNGFEEGEAGWERRRCSAQRRCRRQHEAAAVAKWVRAVESKLTERCAEACDLAWYEVGETITYHGRSVVASLPPGTMEAAARSRERARRN